jgi:catalase
VADSATAEGRLLFNPANLPEGIEVADPMIGVRSAAYKVSYDRRSKTE